MTEFRRRGADRSAQGEADSAFAFLGFDNTPNSSADSRSPHRTTDELLAAAPPPSGPPAAAAPATSPALPSDTSVPLTRRQIREREQAASAAQRAPQGNATELNTTRQHASGKGVKRAKAPRKPKPLRPVKPPRGTSRPPAGPRRPAASPSRPKSLKRRMLSKLMAMGAMVGAGLLMVSTSIPANAFYPVQAATGTVAAPEAPAEAKIQSVHVFTTASQSFSRDNYTAVSLKERLFLEWGNKDWSFTNDPNGTIQWPFPIGVPISSGFGARIAPCGGCSSYHEGVDFTPGGGTPIQAIADGVVSTVRDDSWGLGNHVIIDHHINGHLVQSVYGHMKEGSIRVKVGEHVKVTDIVGLVGSTGASTGNHLHLEIHVDGVQVDPFAWLKKNAN